MNNYNNNHSKDGGKCYLQMFKNVVDDDPLILDVVTPLMARVHSLPQAGEMVFIDASMSLDRRNNPVYFLCTHQPLGALHRCVWVTSDSSQQTISSCLDKAKQLFPASAFDGRGDAMGPQLGMTA